MNDRVTMERKTASRVCRMLAEAIEAATETEMWYDETTDERVTRNVVDAVTLMSALIEMARELDDN